MANEGKDKELKGKRKGRSCQDHPQKVFCINQNPFDQPTIQHPGSSWATLLENCQTSLV